MATKHEAPTREDLPVDLQEFPETITLFPRIETPYHNRRDINQRLLAVRRDDFADKEGLKTDVEHSEVTLNDIEKRKLSLIREILHHPKLEELINQGKITVALIKPHVHKGKSTERDDVTATTILKEEIKPPLKVIFALPTHMTPADVRYFYDSIYPVLSNKPDPETSGKSSVWKRHADYMTSGAITMVLLYSEEGHAIDEWRRQLGPTNPEKDPEGESIRGRYGWDIRGNVGHGSNDDTPEGKIAAVKYEVSWMKAKVDRLLEDNKSSDVFMNEQNLRDNDILQDGEVFIAIEKFMPTQKISTIGCSFTAYIVSLISTSGKLEYRRVMVKSFDNSETKDADINSALATTENQRIASFEHLLARFTPKAYKDNPPIRSTKVYNLTTDSNDNPALVREYIHSNNELANNMANNTGMTPQRRAEFIDGLIFAAATLDVAGIKSKNLKENFLYDGSQWIYIGGCSIDPESTDPRPVKTGLADLLQWFGDDEQMSEEIRKRYDNYYRRINGKKSHPPKPQK